MDFTSPMSREEKIVILRQRATGLLFKDAELFRAGNEIIAHANRRLGVEMPDLVEDADEEEEQAQLANKYV